ncbi:MFS family permease [Symbiobacterium terraclitae]|uniref:MFS family permease n=1 Tax=Symbiobacterium terraclitae TaxID=557451 RepID=A0ABS4JTY6_9FIRM|nr:MFS family permease [Symbiobacterium terraclitae]
MSAVYFFFFGAQGAMTPFLSVFYRSSGLSASQIALLLSVPPVMLFLSQPLFGQLADRLGNRGRLFSQLLVVAALAGGLVSLGSSFWSFLPLVALWSFFAGPLGAIADSIALGEVQRTGASYPQLRLWGSVSWVITSTLGGWLYNRIDLRWSFAFYTIVSLVTLVWSTRLPAEGVTSRSRTLPPISTLFRIPELTGFLLCSGLLQTTIAANSAFLSIHVGNLGGSNSLVGLAWAIAALTEIPVWLYLDRITERFGAVRVVTFAAFMYGLRWALMSLAPAAGMVLVLQAMQAFSFALFAPTAVQIVGRLVPQELRTSGQALLVLVNGGVATVLGNLVAGRLVDLAGTAMLYRATAAVALAAGLGFMLLVRRARSGGAGRQEVSRVG